MMARTALFPALLLLAAALPACTPRRPPPAPTPPPAPVAADPQVEARARAATAQRRFDEGVLLGRQSRWRDAEAKYREAARLDPAEPSYAMALSAALLSQGRASEAADALLAGIHAEERRADPNHRVLAVDYERLIALLARVGRESEIPRHREQLRYHREQRDELVQ